MIGPYNELAPYFQVVEDGDDAPSEEGSEERDLKRRRLEVSPEAAFCYPRCIEEFPRASDRPIIGREQEVARIIQMLSQEKMGLRPLLVGEPNIGKTEVVRKLALSLNRQDTPDNLKGRTVFMIDCKALLGKQALVDMALFQPAVVISEIIRSTFTSDQKPPILFFKDIDQFFCLDRSLIELAPEYLQSLFRHPFTCLASVTGSDKGKNVRKASKALARFRFTPMFIKESSVKESRKITELKLKEEGVIGGLVVLKEPLDLAVRLADTHIKDRTFPLKAVQVVQQAAMRAWTEDYLCVQPIHVAEVISQETGIPAQQLMNPDVSNLVAIQKRFQENLIGQDHAIAVGIKALQRNQLGISDPTKPRFVGLLVGPTGVGKTEFTKLFAEINNLNLIHVDMSEYQEKYSVSRLTGSPPGYVGYGEGGSFCASLRRDPYSVVLLDEVEKAHPNVMQTFLQIFDDGRITDGEGNTVDCSKAWFFMTSNLGAEELLQMKDRQTTQELMRTVNPYIHDHFRPEFINRITEIVPFQSLTKDDCLKIAEIHLKRIKTRMKHTHRVALAWDDGVCEYFVERYYDLQFGARKLCRQVEKRVGDMFAHAAEVDPIKRGREYTLECHEGKLGMGWGENNLE